METNKNKNGMIIGSVLGVVVIAIVIILIVILTNKKEEAYRLIKVFEVEGTSKVNRAGTGVLDAYANMVLESGDQVNCEKGKLTLKLDEDKYVYMEEDSEIILEATGSSENSKTRIMLQKGALTNEIQNKLSDDSAYEVNSPNSAMTVRGTIFRSEIYEENGTIYTRTTVFAGTVDTSLIMKDGTYGTTKSVTAGKEIIVSDDGTIVEFLDDPKDIDYSTLPKGVIDLLIKMVKEDRLELDISLEELEELDEEDKGPFTVTFMYQGTVFGTQTVKKGECASEPTLLPAQSGAWDFDFTKPITEDTEIQWK